MFRGKSCRQGIVRMIGATEGDQGFRTKEKKGRGPKYIKVSAGLTKKKRGFGGGGKFVSASFNGTVSGNREE